MEEFNETHAGTHSPFLMVAICLVALGLSGVALFIALTGANKPQEAQIERIQALETKLQEAVAKTHELETDNAKIHEHLKRLTQESQEAFNSVGLEMGKLHSGIKSNRDELEKMHNHLSNSQKEVPTATKTQRSRTYTIQSGDTFASVAKEHNLSVQTLVNANPGLDPRNLRIGEIIQLPAGE